jgi:hypothetical protein
MRRSHVAGWLALALAAPLAAQNGDPAPPADPPAAPAEPASAPSSPASSASPGAGAPGSAAATDAASALAPARSAPAPSATDFPILPGSGPADGFGWHAWWRFNGESALDLGARLSEIDRTRVGDRADTQRASAAVAGQVIARVVPALRSMLSDGADPLQARSALLALGEIESSWTLPDDLRLGALAPAWTASSNHDLAEASLVALGLTGRKQSVDDLLEVLSDSSVGRALCKASLVDQRRRAFAAYALGLAALRSRDEATSRRVALGLIDQLRAGDAVPPDVQLACVTALGFAPLAACASHADAEWHVCRTRELEFLLDWSSQAKRPARHRAQACLALARVAAVAPDAAAEGARERLAEALAPSAKSPPEVLQACAIGLGLVGDADEDALDERIRDVLLRSSSKGDPLARNLALVSLARVGARPGRGQDRGRAREAIGKALLARLGRARADRGWAALAIGVFGRGLARSHQEMLAELAGDLRVALAGSRSTDDAAAYCVALALLGDAEAAPALAERWEKSQESGLRSCAALSMGWIGARDAAGSLAKRFLAGPRANELFASAATALRLLGEPTVVPGLVEMLHAELARKETSTAARCAALLGQLGDGRALESLARIAGDERQRPELRSACAGALAELCDTHPRRWRAAIAADSPFSLHPSTLSSPSGNGTGLLDMR